MTRILLALWLGLASLAVPAAPDLLEPEKAFRFSARALGASAVEVHFEIADGYYMYRERFKFSAGTARLGKPQFPPGEKKKDQFFGETETYRILRCVIRLTILIAILSFLLILFITLRS